MRMALAIDIMDERGLSNEVHCERLIKEGESDTVLAMYFIRGGISGLICTPLATWSECNAFNT